MSRIVHSLSKRLQRLRRFPVLASRRGGMFLLDPDNWIDNRLLAGAPFEHEQLGEAARLIRAHSLDTFIDIGANIGATARQLADFALMGAAMARAILDVERPRVGLLNIGAEEIKGIEEVRQAHAWLKETDLPIDYRGFVEGDQIGQGVVDVVVVEGFAGNIALKTAEGTAKQIGTYLKDAMTRTWTSKLGAMLARGGFRTLKEKMDPRRVNGGTFLGLNGIAVKSHGGTDALGFASAVDLGYEMAESNLVARLEADLAVMQEAMRVSAAGVTVAGVASANVTALPAAGGRTAEG